jgi:predicted phage-related endonuclease|nr:MAG TPA: Protein of unknown function (DUF1492) [Caudoviricetes sp.]
MNKRDLEQVVALKNEIKDIERRLQNNNISSTVADSVKGSSSSFPYIECHKTIRGVDYKKQIRDSRYRKMIISKKKKIEKLLRQIEYDLNYIEDSEIRQIIRYKYFDNFSWIKIMHLMNYDSESKARMKLERFLKNL